MKKLLFFSLLSLLVFSSCNFLQKKPQVPQGTPADIIREKKVGVVSQPDYIQGTNASRFVLIAEDGSTVPIDSALVNLKRYKRRRIEVQGRFNDTRNIFIVDQVTSLGHETQSKTIYQNPELGIKFLYPTVWSMKEQKNTLGDIKVRITPYDIEEAELSSVDRIFIERSENNRRLAPKEWLGLNDSFARTTQNIDEPAAVFQASAIGVQQLSAIKKTIGTGATIAFYLQRDAYMYILSHTSVHDAEKDLYRNAFFDTLASFEFIPFSDSASILTKAVVSTEPQVPDPSLGHQEKIPEPTASSDIVKKGMSLLEARQFKITLQYPSSWYWAYSNGKYYFNTKPITPDNVQDSSMSLTKTDTLFLYNKSKLITPIGGRQASEGYGETYYMCVKGKTVYCLSGTPAIVKAMLETLVEQ